MILRLEAGHAIAHWEPVEEISSLHFDSSNPDFQETAATPRVDLWLNHAPVIAHRLNPSRKYGGTDLPDLLSATEGISKKHGKAVVEVLYNAVRNVDFEFIAHYSTESSPESLALYLRQQLGIPHGETLFLEDLRHGGQEKAFYYFLPVSQEDDDKLKTCFTSGSITADVHNIFGKALARTLDDLPFKAYALYLPTQHETITSRLLLVLAPIESPEK